MSVEAHVVEAQLAEPLLINIQLVEDLADLAAGLFVAGKLSAAPEPPVPSAKKEAPQ